MTAMQVGCGWKSASQMHIAQAGHCMAQGVPYKAKFAEFKVSRDAFIPTGTQLTAAHFIPGIV